jgi:hypothetical protein
MMSDFGVPTRKRDMFFEEGCVADIITEHPPRYKGRRETDIKSSILMRMTLDNRRKYCIQ